MLSGEPCCCRLLLLLLLLLITITPRAAAQRGPADLVRATTHITDSTNAREHGQLEGGAPPHPSIKAIHIALNIAAAACASSSSLVVVRGGEKERPAVAAAT